MKEDNQLEEIMPKHKEKANFYHIEVKRALNKRKVITISIISVVIIVFIVVVTNIIIQKKIKEQEYKEYITQIEHKQKEEQEKILAQKEIERQAKLPKITEQGLDNFNNIYHSDIKRVFLTFDDGPSTNTETILNILKQESVKVTFFELGVNVDATPELVKRAYDEGHYIANHGYSHVYSHIYSSLETVLEEYNQCQIAIRNAIGINEYDGHLFRFPGGGTGGPYGDLKVQAKEMLKQNKILNIDWNALSGDAEGNNLPVEALMNRLENTVGSKNSIVLLMHDSKAKTTTVDALPQIIGFFRDRGYEFKNFYDIIK